MTQVYAAKYSNVPVWVSNANNVSVMRRQGDGWVNATHLLKVANFDKPRRTRILERDVQTGEHEKVQGGYGKYQGTWIPVDRAYTLSRQVGILEHVESLLAYSPQDGVEAAALPKQVKTPVRRQPSGTTLSGQKAKRPKKMPGMMYPAQPMHSMPLGVGMPPMGMPPGMSPLPGQAIPGAVPGSAPGSGPPSAGPGGPNVMRAQAMQSMPPLTTNFPWQFSPQSPYTPVPGMGQQLQMMPPTFPVQSPYYVSEMSPAAPRQVPEPPQTLGSAFPRDPSRSSSPSMSSEVLSSNDDGFSDDEKPAPPPDFAANDAHAAARANAWTQGPSHYMANYSSKLLNFFMSPDKTVIPASLLEPEPGMDLDHPIDDEGNTAFHWTCAIGRVELVRALVAAGVNTRALNRSGQTALSFLVQFTNNYESRTFPKLLDLLADQVAFVDPKGRTVLHHIANTATNSSRSATARYYAEILLARVSSRGKNEGDDSLQGLPEAQGHPSGSLDPGANSHGTSEAPANPQASHPQNIPQNITQQSPQGSSQPHPQLNRQTGVEAQGGGSHMGHAEGNPWIKPNGFAEWLDYQDNKGETALHIASRQDSRKLVKVLLSYKASPLIPNKLGETPDDLYTRAKKRREEAPPARPLSQPEGIMRSEAAHAAEVAAAEIAEQLRELAQSYDQAISNKDSDIAQVQTLVDKIRQDIVEVEMALPALRAEIGAPTEVEQNVQQLHQQAADKLSQIRQLIERSQAHDLAQSVHEEESRAPELDVQLTEHYQVDRAKQQRLGAELAGLQKNRKVLVGEIGALYAEAGSSDKIAKYRKLLAVCCEVPEQLVDGLLDGINNALDANSA